MTEEKLDVPQLGEVDLDQLAKVVFLGGQGGIGQKLDEIAKVVAGVEGQPIDIVDKG